MTDDVRSSDKRAEFISTQIVFQPHTQTPVARPQAGDTVLVHYTGRLEDGTEFDSSQGSQLLRFTLGAEQVIPGFENAVLNLEPGQSQTVALSPEDGYGPRRDDLVAAMPRNQVPPDVRVGQHLQLPLDDEGQLPVIVTDVSETTVTFDANHPLAGQMLIFDIELVDAS